LQRLAEIWAMIAEGRLGFRIDEVMSGEHEFDPRFGSPGKRPMEFRVTWGPRHILQWGNPSHHRFMVGELEGTVTIAGLCDHTPCTGSLELRYLEDHAIRYSFEFKQGNQSYTYMGETVHIHLWNLPRSHTTCFGRLILAGTGELVSTSVTHFRLRSLLRFLASVRLA
jgi:hypothetical protein